MTDTIKDSNTRGDCSRSHDMAGYVLLERAVDKTRVAQSFLRDACLYGTFPSDDLHEAAAELESAMDRFYDKVKLHSHNNQ